MQTILLLPYDQILLRIAQLGNLLQAELDEMKKDLEDKQQPENLLNVEIRMEEKLPLLKPETSAIVSEVRPTSWIKWVKIVCYLIHYCYIGCGLIAVIGSTHDLIQKYGSTWYQHIFDKHPFDKYALLSYPYVFYYFIILPLCIIPILMLKMNSKSLIFRLCTIFFCVAFLPDLYFDFMLKVYGNTLFQKICVFCLHFHPFALCILPLLELKINS